METKFISEFGVEDLSNVKISVEENNSKLADTMFSKFTLPYERKATAEFIKMYGDYVSNESNNLKNLVPGFLQFENKIHEAKKNIQSITGFNISEQIDFGFEELPNFDKKLSELPLAEFTVVDIHLFAKEIAAKKWPETTFNFPRIYSTKYSPDTKMWDAYDGYYNDLKTDGSEMKKNYTDNLGEIFNVNIIQPLPHILYVLEKGFEDAGYHLEGDILSDPVLQNKWMFSGKEYFTKINQFANTKNVKSNEIIKEEWKYNTSAGKYVLFTYGTSEQMNFQDKVFVNGAFTAKIRAYTKLKFVIRLNGNDIWQHEETVYDYTEITKAFSLEINVNNEAISFHIEGSMVGIDNAYEVINYELKSNSIINTTDQTQNFDNSMVNNENKINLKRAVPDITFGEFFNIIKNWFNYDLEIIDNRAIMNKIAEEQISDVKDFTKFESENPKRTFLNKRSFLLKFADLDDDYKKNSMYFDSLGPKLNGAENEDTSVIEINGYVMPVKLPKENGHNTAFVQKDSNTTLSLVDYDGLKNGQNNANGISDCDFPALFESHWKNWLKIRLNAQEFSWSSYVNIEQFAQYNIKNFIYAYNNVHIIKSWSKEQVSDTIYNVEFITETVS